MSGKSKSWGQQCYKSAHFCGHCCVLLLCWSLWLGFSLLAIAQLHVAVTRELPVPSFIVHELEDRLADSGVHANFGRTSFDPTGRILIEDASFSLKSFEKPIASIKLLYLHLDPWDLLVGDFTPHRFEASGVGLRVPAMLSSTGRQVEALHDITVSAEPTDNGILIQQLTARLANLTFSAEGEIDFRPLTREQASSIPLAELLARDYAKLCRKFEQLAPYLTQLENPRAEIRLNPSEQLGALAEISIHADQLHASDNVSGEITNFAASTKLPLWSNRPIFARIHTSIESVDLPRDIHLEGIRATLYTKLFSGESSIPLLNTKLEIASAQAMGVNASALSTQIDSRHYPILKTQLLAQIEQEPLELSGKIDTKTRSADLRVVGRFDPRLMTVIGQKAGRDIRRFVDFGQAPSFDFDLKFSPGMKFTQLSGRVAARDVYAYRVTFDQIGGHLFFDGTDFIATDAKANIGSNYARGSYQQNFTTQKFRFLLKGQLDPPDISGWFRDWWPKFWENFDFSAAAPQAEVDVQGRWRYGHETTVFAYAESLNPIIKGVELDQIVTSIFVRPHHYDALGLLAVGGGGIARGNFLRSHIPNTHILRSMTFSFDSTLPANTAAGLAGPQVEKVIAPFSFTQNPSIIIEGRINGEGLPGEPQIYAEISGHTDHAFTFHGFPLTHASFTGVLNDDDFIFEPLLVGFAQGETFGRARLEGPEENRRLGFDLNLQQANLRSASVILENYGAKLRGESPPTTSEYVKQTAQVFADVDVSGEGDVGDLYSFYGEGSASLSGPGIGEIRLLGLLSGLINFTALDFTQLDSNFTVEGKSLEFSEVSLTGPNAAVSATGNYTLPSRTLDFNARIFPFQESKFILKSVMGAVLTPFSNVLEVKLTGDLGKPSWAFVIGPTNFFRNLIKKPDELKDPLAPEVPEMPE